MEFKKYATFLWAMALCAGSFSCDNDIEGEEPADTVITSDFFILNRGNFNANNASLAFFDHVTGAVNGKFYEDANGSGLGDSAEDMLVYGSKIYVCVTTSNRLAILDKKGKLLKAIEPKAENAPAGPRYLAASNGKVYMTYFSGHSVAVLDTASMEVEKVIPVGRYPEQLAVVGTKLYVANSGGGDHPNYGKTVSIINLSSLSVEKEIEVMINPCHLEANGNGDVYVISMGDYSDKYPNTLQRIDGKTGEVTSLGNGSRMDLQDGYLYVLYVQWGKEDLIRVSKYDASTGKIVNDNLVPEIKKVSTLSSLKVDPSGNLYITDAPYTETGSVYVYNKDGEEVTGSPVDTKGYGPNTVWFMGN